MKASPLRRLLPLGWGGADEHSVGNDPVSSPRFRLGILGRLGIAFAAVGALVLAANLIVEEGILVERTTLITRTMVPPVPKPGPTAATPLPAPDSAAPPARSVTPDALLQALGRFDDAVLERVTSKTDPSEAQYQRSTKDVSRFAAAFITSAESISGKSFGTLGAVIKGHQREGKMLVRASDNRREMIEKYATLFEALNARTKDALDKSWKIFGRVVARQSLLQLSADLDSLRRHTTALNSERNDPSDLDALGQAEQVVQKQLEGNETSLRRSEGDLWYSAVVSDFTALVALRIGIVQANEQLSGRVKEFSESAARLPNTVPRKVESSARAPPSHKDEATPAEPAVQAAPIAAGMTAVSPSPGVETRSVVREAPHGRSKRALIAWISAGSMIVLTYILADTVLSIVRPVRHLLRATADLARGETRVRVQRGGIRELDSVAVAFNLMAAEVAAARASARDYQQSLELKVAERTLELKELAEHDPLTGLPNRREWTRRLHDSLESAREAGAQVGLFFLDVDNFKFINDSAGHAFGDRVLVSLAERLRATTQAFGFCARFGGDEFTVVFDRATSTEDIRGAGMSIVQAFQQPLTVDGRELIVSVSVGASIFPQHERDAEALLKAADVALFRAKELGRGQLSIFTPELMQAAAAKFATEQGLRRAVERGEFELVYQPEIDVDTLETSLVEALVRWRMPDGSLVPPGQFLTIAEESGLILEIGDWVLRAAIEAAAHWHHGAWPEVRVAINVSPRQFMDPGFIDRLQSLLQTHRLPARCIEIELTESVLQTGPGIIAALKRLRAHGVAIALDDFGSGYSSLASLEQLPLTRIKLDRGLIEGIDKSPRSAAIAHAIITLCQGLGLEITAEGIERPEQFAMLLKHRGMYLQGFLLSRPISRDELMPAMAQLAQRCQELLLHAQIAEPVVAVPLHAVDMSKQSRRMRAESG